MKLWFDSFLLIIIALIFLSSSLDKMMNRKSSIFAISNYGVSYTIAKIIYLPLVLMELFLGITILFYGINIYNFLLLTIFIITLSLIVLKNLIKGNKSIPCGCGGILENDELSANIIYRNIFIILFAFYLLVNHIILTITIYQTTLLIVSAISLLLMVSASKELFNINKLRKKLLNYF